MGHALLARVEDERGVAEGVTGLEQLLLGLAGTLTLT
jgi:hypothetical protein